MKLRSILNTLSALLLLAIHGASAQSERAALQQFLETHCMDCHEGKKPKGDFSLETLKPAFGDAAAEAEEQGEAA